MLSAWIWCSAGRCAHPHWHPSGCTVRSDSCCVHLDAPHNLYLWQLSAGSDHCTNTLLLRDIQEWKSTTDTPTDTPRGLLSTRARIRHSSHDYPFLPHLLSFAFSLVWMLVCTSKSRIKKIFFCAMSRDLSPLRPEWVSAARLPYWSRRYTYTVCTGPCAPACCLFSPSAP